MDSMNLTVFFPCYNEEANLERVVKEAFYFLPKMTDDFEILIINDGSMDKTGQIAANLARENKKIRVFHHKKNKGYGAALKTGFKNSKKDLVFFTDGDGQFDIKELAKLTPYNTQYDIVTGYRTRRRDPIIRRINANLWNFLINIIFGIGVRDINCAFKLFQRKIFDTLDIKSDGAFINAEIFAQAKRKGYKIKEVGVSHYPRKEGRQTGANVKVIIKAFIELFLLWRSLA